MTYYYCDSATPVGNLRFIASDQGLAAILWENDNPNRVRATSDVEDPNHPVLVETRRQLTEYFNGKRQQFSLDLDPIGTEFQKQVWAELRKIPFGETISYAELAVRIGNPKASRAVGAANGKNPISIVIPCHRVIGSSGKLTGFAGGLETKSKLLHLEGIGNLNP